MLGDVRDLQMVGVASAGAPGVDRVEAHPAFVGQGLQRRHTPSGVEAVFPGVQGLMIELYFTHGVDIVNYTVYPVNSTGRTAGARTA